MQIIVPNIDATFYGQIKTGLVQTKVDIQYNPRTGGRTTVNYEGKLADVQVAATEFQLQGWETHMWAQGEPTWQLEVAYTFDYATNTDTTPNVVWNLTEEPIEQNLLAATDRPIIASLSTTTKVLIQNALKKNLINPVLTDTDHPAGATEIANAQTVYNLMAQGETSRQLFIPTLTQTATVNTTSPFNWPSSNKHCVLSRGYLTNTYNTPYFITSQLPTDSPVTVTDASTGVVTNYGYLEGGTTRTNVAGNKIQVQRKWTYNKWADIAYPFLTN